MLHEVVGRWLDLGSGGILALVGAGVLLVRPRRPVNVWFAVFAISFGLRFVFNTIFRFTDPRAAMTVWLGVAATLVATVALVGLVLRYPRPLASAKRRLLVLPTLVGTAFALVGGWATYVSMDDPRVRVFLHANNVTPAMWFTITLAMMVGTLHFALILLALRFRFDAPPGMDSSRHERSVALSGAALLPYPAFIAGYGPYDGQSIVGAGPSAGSLFAYSWSFAGLLAVAAGALVWLTAIPRARHARLPRNLALFALALPLLGVMAAAWAVGSGWHGITRIVTVALLAYAILRHQLFDIDLKVKWTLRQSSVALVFVAVFLVVTEGAQVLFGQENPWLGIGVAALLVFALSPLQRFAGLVADTAMPAVEDTTAYRVRRKEEVYEGALEEVLRDGALTIRERKVLLRLQRDLGLDGNHANALEEKVIGQIRAT